MQPPASSVPSREAPLPAVCGQEISEERGEEKGGVTMRRVDWEVVGAPPCMAGARS